jgi:hypothetical protein
MELYETITGGIMSEEKKDDSNEEERPLDKAVRESGEREEFEEAIELHKTYGGS